MPGGGFWLSALEAKEEHVWFLITIKKKNRLNPSERATKRDISSSQSHVMFYWGEDRSDLQIILMEKRGSSRTKYKFKT